MFKTLNTQQQKRAWNPKHGALYFEALTNTVLAG
jgi:hypothetical protein